MSVLAPLYLLGLAAISLPLVFHLIRRTPRRETQFSSLMFLEPSPPRITRRSRLDNLLLLLLRALAITLLAVAFARPFFRQSARTSPSDAMGERVAVLVDASASMRRGDLWRQAVAAVDETLKRYRPQDQYSLYAFDLSLRPIVSRQDLAQVPSAQRRATALARLREFSPTWAATSIGQAMGDALASLEGEGEPDAQKMVGQRRVVIVSDLQQGGRLSDFSQYEWPDDAVLELVPVTTGASTNAGLALLGQRSNESEEPTEEKLRVRVINSTDSISDSFRLEWRNASGDPLDDATDVYVPPGESRVARVSLPATRDEYMQLSLTGDDFDFDNTVHYVRPEVDQARVIYSGVDDVGDADGMAYYVARAVESVPLGAAVLEQAQPDSALLTNAPPELVVVTAQPTKAQCTALRDYMRAGGTTLYVVQEGDDAALGALVGGDAIEVTEADVDDYALLGEIDFRHPLFAPMAGPQFNNFTQIHFWKHRQVDRADLSDAAVLARFDSGAPAIIEQRIGRGKLIVFTSSWRPADSQLARSWKFLLMLSALINQGRGDSAFSGSYLIGEQAPLPNGIDLPQDAFLTKPDGTRILIQSGVSAVEDTDSPGVYAVSTTERPAMFSVHVDPLESETAPLPQEAFEQLGCRLAGEFDPATANAELRQMRDIELEGQQKVWKYLVAVALLLLIVETLLAGKLSRPTAPQPAPA
ncbi:hypothetical protein KOR34_37590 [Posidoniimonas corsicana]|uniref:VWFA domain-containing protein n=1 Tax=Posidoniimonas corsicana TaxID=1938618 RepID=A0A5C5V7H0_9BACT|nr:BatA domain-containing protein [Posidoniimonas corsicana]TWT33923.1 hypothetical protein KOR34_37590 [Posidoniimonas corsicana]